MKINWRTWATRIYGFIIGLGSLAFIFPMLRPQQCYHNIPPGPVTCLLIPGIGTAIITLVLVLAGGLIYIYTSEKLES